MTKDVDSASPLDIPVRAWIRVSSSLPESGTQVWITFSFPDQTGQGYAIYDEGEWFFDVTTDGDLYSRRHAIKDGCEVAEVTHWMPLPPPPNVKVSGPAKAG